MAAAVQRNAIDASRQRLTLRQTRRMVPIMFSMMLVQASERRSDSGRPKPDHRQHLVETFQNGGRDARRHLFQPTRQLADQPLGLLRVIQFPCAHRGVQVLGQPFDDVASLMNLAALDRRVATEGAADRLGQRLRTIDDEQPADVRIQPALDQIVQQRLYHSGVLGGAFQQTERMFGAITINAHRCEQGQLTGDMQGSPDDLFKIVGVDGPAASSARIGAVSNQDRSRP